MARRGQRVARRGGGFRSLFVPQAYGTFNGVAPATTAIGKVFECPSKPQIASTPPQVTAMNVHRVFGEVDVWLPSPLANGGASYLAFGLYVAKRDGATGLYPAQIGTGAEGAMSPWLWHQAWIMGWDATDRGIGNNSHYRLRINVKRTLLIKPDMGILGAASVGVGSDAGCNFTVSLKFMISEAE